MGRLSYPPSLRNRSTTIGKALAKAATSSSVVDHPTLTRRLRSASTPMASRTGDGAIDPDGS